MKNVSKNMNNLVDNKMSGTLESGQPPLAAMGRQGLYDPQYEKDSCGVGFIAHIKGKQSHQIIEDADLILRRMSHRSACGCEKNTGDGAGMLTTLPHKFLQKVASNDMQVELPERGHYGVGIVFLPTDSQQRKQCKETVNHYIEDQGQKLLGWRMVPTDADRADIGPSARASEPVIEQVFIAGAE